MTQLKIHFVEDFLFIWMKLIVIKAIIKQPRVLYVSVSTLVSTKVDKETPLISKCLYKAVCLVYPRGVMSMYDPCILYLCVPCSCCSSKLLGKQRLP